MAILPVNATRMELNKLKIRLTTTRKGHKLLKNKVDGLLKEFLAISKKTILLKKEIKEKIKYVNIYLKLAATYSSKEMVDLALENKTKPINIKVLNDSILGVLKPSFLVEEKIDPADFLNYSFFSNSYYLDLAIKQQTKLNFKLIELSEAEKTILILAEEIKKTRRKVNAIENILIPNFNDTIKYISLKLDENERSTIARLNRIK